LGREAAASRYVESEMIDEKHAAAGRRRFG
jgi:hypothetical protein